MPTSPLRRSHDAHAHAGGHFNESDPHGSGAAHHHGVSKGMLRFVLVVLLAFTVLTVGAAQFEVFIQNALDIVLPKWVNVVIAMSIAVVKGALVILFFMQLKYDNPINGVIFLFTLVGVGLFLGFTILDLGTRGRIYEYKGQQIVAGGTGNSLSRTTKDGTNETISGSITSYVRDQKIQKIGEAEYQKLFEKKHAGHGHHGHDDHAAVSDAQRTRPRTGRTDALGSAPADTHADPAHADPGHQNPEHAGDPKPAAQ